MENKLGFLGKHNETSVFLNMGKYGFYLNFNDKLFSVPAVFQTDKFNLESAIKIIEYKSKLIKEEKKLENDSTEDIVDIVKSIKNKKSLKKTSNE
jgi:topoisomerase IA-like protein